MDRQTQPKINSTQGKSALSTALPDAPTSEPAVASGLWFSADELTDFIEDLHAHGYNIGVGEHIAAQNLVLALAARGVDMSDPARLKRLLGPLLVSTRTEQEDFSGRFDEWAARFKPNDQVIPPRPRRRVAWQPVLTILVFGVVALALVVIVAFFLIGAIFGNAIGSLFLSSATGTSPAATTQAASPLGGIDYVWLLWAFVFGAALIFLLALLPRIIAMPFLQRASLQEPPDLTTLNLAADAGQALFPNLTYLHLAQGLRQRVEVPARELDVTRTVQRTIQRGGWFTPAFTVRRIMPEYLVLIDRSGAGDHQARFVAEMISQLRQHNVYMSAYYFDGDPRLCFALEGGPPETLWEITTKGNHQRLIIFSDGAGLLHPLTGELQDWLNLFNPLAQRALVTPLPVDQWGYSEQQLSQRFQLLPLSSEGLMLFIKSFQGVETAPELPDRRSAQLPDELRLRPLRWLAQSPPEPPEVESMLGRLHRYLGDEGYLWLSACAVYPEIHWELTLFLGEKLQEQPELFGKTKSDEPSLLTPRRLVNLARLPWLRAGKMPDWLRLSLVGGLSKAQEQAIRQALSKVLDTAIEEKDKNLRLQVAGGSVLRNLLLRHWRRTAKSGSPYRDIVYLSYMSGQNPNRLAVRLPETVRRLMRARRTGQSIPPLPQVFKRENITQALNWIFQSSIGAVLGSLVGLILLVFLNLAQTSFLTRMFIETFSIGFMAIFQAWWLYRQSQSSMQEKSDRQPLVFSAASVFAWLVASLVSAAIGWTFVEHLSIGGWYYYLLPGLAYGLSQGVVLDRHSRRGWWWLPGMAAAWLVSLVIMESLGLTVSNGSISQSNSISTQSSIVFLLILNLEILLTNLLTAPLLVWLLQPAALREEISWGQPFRRWFKGADDPAASRSQVQIGSIKVVLPVQMRFLGLWLVVSVAWAGLYYALIQPWLPTLFGSSDPTSIVAEIVVPMLVSNLLQWYVLARCAGVGLDYAWFGSAAGVITNAGLYMANLNSTILSTLAPGVEALAQVFPLNRISRRAWIWTPIVIIESLVMSQVQSLLGYPQVSSSTDLTLRLIETTITALITGLALLWILQPVWQPSMDDVKSRPTQNFANQAPNKPATKVSKTAEINQEQSSSISESLESGSAARPRSRLAQARGRELYNYEFKEAYSVFQNGLDYSQVRIFEDYSLPTVLDRFGRWLRRMPPPGPNDFNAITIGYNIYLPIELPTSYPEPDSPDSFKLEWLIHELTHCWQFEHEGLAALWRSLTVLFRPVPFDFGGREALIMAQKQGKRLRDFNIEQQAEIVRGYYNCLHNSQETGAFRPFIEELSGAGEAKPTQPPDNNFTK